MWDRTVIDLGTINAPLTAGVSFHHTGVITGFIAKPSCGCTVPEWNPITNTLAINVSIGKIPKHLKTEGKYVINKTVAVEYTEEGKQKKEVLIIKAIAQ